MCRWKKKTECVVEILHSNMIKTTKWLEWHQWQLILLLLGKEEQQLHTVLKHLLDNRNIKPGFLQTITYTLHLNIILHNHTKVLIMSGSNHQILITLQMDMLHQYTEAEMQENNHQFIICTLHRFINRKMMGCNLHNLQYIKVQES